MGVPDPPLPRRMARRPGARTAMFDRREQLVCSRCGGRVRYDCQCDPSGHDRWRPLPGASGEGFGQERSGSAKTRSQCLLLQWDARELSLHEIEFVCDHREVRARLNRDHAILTSVRLACTRRMQVIRSRTDHTQYAGGAARHRSGCKRARMHACYTLITN